MLSYLFSDPYCFFFRAPGLPITCFHGNCFSDCVEVLREHNTTVGLKFHLVTEGKESFLFVCSHLFYNVKCQPFSITLISA